MQPYVLSESVVSGPLKRRMGMQLPKQTLDRIRRIKAQDQKRQAAVLQRQIERLKRQVVSGR